MLNHSTTQWRQRACSAVFLMLALAACWLPSARSQSVPACAFQPPSGPPRNRTVNIAIMFWGPPAVNGVRQEVWTRNPLLDGWNGSTPTERLILQAYLLWEERMQLPAPYGGGPGLILLDGSVMRLNISWFHAGSIDTASLVDEYDPATANSWPAVLVQRLANATGPYGRQHFIITPLPSHVATTMRASLACEASQSCMSVSPAAPNTRMFVCQDPVPVDCTTRGRREGSRRFEYTVSAASNGDQWGSGSLVFAVNRGLKRVFIVAEPWGAPVITQLRATSAQLGLEVMGVQMVEAFGNDWAALNTSVAEVTGRIQRMGVGLVIVLSGFPTPTIAQLIQHWREIDYLPAAVSLLAGGAAALPEDLRSYFLIESFWLPQLTGPAFRALNSEANFETFPANETHDSPAVFADAYRERFNVQPPLSSFFQAVRSFHAITIVQKLLELAQADDIESVRYASTRIATPGVFHAVQFDQWGRSMPFDNYLLQLMPDGTTRILTPLGLGSPPVIPIPNWSEREFKPVFLSKTSDRVAFGLAAATVVYLLCWIAWLIAHWHHSLIRVADPVSSVLSLCGLIVLVSSNFWSTYLESSATCLASSWLFIIGLTLGFAPLALKNLRIWSLWHNSASFNPAPIRQRHTVYALGALVLIDLVMMTVWQVTTNMPTAREMPDPYRPALDYYSCDVYRHSRALVMVGMGWKALGLIGAMYLAYLLRNVSSKYSESRFIALCVYNVTIVLAVLMPVMATNAAGHEGTQLVRNFLIIFLCVTTASLMFVPKFVAIRRSASQKHERPVHGVGTPNGSESAADAQSHRPPHTLQLTQQPRLPALHSPAPDSHPTQRPATDPGQLAGSVVHSAHFPVSAPAPTGGQRADLRTPDWPPAQQPAFQSMIGISQIERRYVEEDSEPPRSDAQSHLASRSSRFTSRHPGHPPAMQPALLLPAIPQSPQHQSRTSSDPSMAASVLQETVELVCGMEPHELADFSSCLRRRYLFTPSEDRSPVTSSPFACAVAPVGLSLPSASASVPAVVITPPTSHGASPCSLALSSSGPGQLLTAGARSRGSHSSAPALAATQASGDSSEDDPTVVSFYDA